MNFFSKMLRRKTDLSNLSGYGTGLRPVAQGQPFQRSSMSSTSAHRSVTVQAEPPGGRAFASLGLIPSRFARGVGL